MGDIKVTEVYGGEDEPGLHADHMIVSDELKDLLDISINSTRGVTPDVNELTITVESDGTQNGLVHGDLFSISSGEYLTIRFNAKSNCRDMLQVLRSATQPGIKSVTIDVAGDYGFQAAGDAISSWEISLLEDRSALLTIVMGINDVVFR